MLTPWIIMTVLEAIVLVVVLLRQGAKETYSYHDGYDIGHASGRVTGFCRGYRMGITAERERCKTSA